MIFTALTIALFARTLVANNLIFDIPSISYAELISLDHSTLLSAVNSLVTLGVIQISDIPNFGTSRLEALEHLSLCLIEDHAAAKKSILNDGSYRLTVGISQVNTKHSLCVEKSTKLQSLVDATTRRLFLGFDKIASSKIKMGMSRDLMTPYKSYSDLFNNGDHLEHLHAYYGLKNSTESLTIGSTLPMHKDAGLLIAMTSGYYSGLSKDADAANTQSNGLFMEMPTGDIVELKSSKDSLIIMVGDAGAKWLAPKMGQPLRAVSHALSIQINQNNQLNTQPTRAWYGKMYLPPKDSLIASLGMTYGEYRAQEVQAMQAQQKSSGDLNDYKPFAKDPKSGIFSSSLPIACDSSFVFKKADINHQPSSTTRNVLLSTTTCDDDTGILCWTQCIPIANLTCGLDAQCVNTVDSSIVDGSLMCPSASHHDCELQCISDSVKESSHQNSSSSSRYCYGDGTTMYMDGFRSLAAYTDDETPCINLLFLDWTLNNKWKFGLACAGTFLLGIFIQFISRVRATAFATKFDNDYVMKISITFLYALQVILGYFAMLIAMTYNVELFIMICSGLVVGFAAFNIHTAPTLNTDPCCSDQDISVNYKALPNSHDRGLPGVIN